MKININLPKNRRKARNNKKSRGVRMPAPFKQGNTVFGPGKTSLLFHKDESFASELQDLYMTSIMSDNDTEMAWAMSAFQFYKIVKVNVIVYPGPSSGVAYLGFYWNNTVISDARDFVHSDTTKIAVFPCMKPKLFTYYPVNAIIMDIGSGYNYRDWIPTTQTTLPGKLYYINDGGNANFRVQVLIKFRGSRTKTVNNFINIFNKLSSSKLLLTENSKNNINKEKEEIIKEEEEKEESEESIKENQGKIKIEIEKQKENINEIKEENKDRKNKSKKKYINNKFLDYFD